MKNKDFWKHLPTAGKVIAIVGAILSMVPIIPGNAGLGWILVIIGAAMVLIGNMFNQE